MSLFLASLNSGSNGNCYYIGNEDEAVLIDAGISCRETEKRMARLGLSLEKVKAIFISHEHTDHIKGLDVLSKKYGIPVHITAKTLANSKLSLRPDLIRSFTTDFPAAIGKIQVHAFRKTHDAADPCSFTVESGDVRIAVITDIGHCCDEVIYHFAHSDAAILESNYDPFLLENGRYPYYLKKRISGGKGHISNHQALELFLNHRSERLSHLLLGHLSRDNNHPDLVADLFSSHSGATKIHVASRDGASPVFEIRGSSAMSYHATDRYVKTVQLSMF